MASEEQHPPIPPGKFKGGGGWGDQRTTEHQEVSGSQWESGSTFSLDYGSRQMKAYPIVDAELNEIFGLGVSAMVCLSIASVCLGFWFDILVALSITETINEATRAEWSAYRNVSFWIMLVFYGASLILILVGNSKISKIKKSAIFDSESGQSGTGGTSDMSGASG